MKKILGWFFVCAGLGIIIFSAAVMFDVFLNKKPPVMLIEHMNFAINTQYGPMSLDNPSLVLFLNLILHAVFMVFMLGIGGRLALLGTNFLKVDVIEENLQKGDVKKI